MNANLTPDFNGKVAIVTGATSGIGKATARMLAEGGARVGVLSHRRDKTEACAAELREKGLEALPLVADVSSPSAMRVAYKEIERNWGRLDILFANAGINGTWAPLDELSPDEWGKTIGVNLTGTFLTLKYAVPLLKQSQGSAIINASVNGTRVFSNTGASAYASSKAGQTAFAKMAALELAKHRIRVNVICPGAIATPIHDKTKERHLDEIQEPVEFPEGSIPLTDGRPGDPEDVARLVLFLASDAARHITGTEVYIDGGESLLMG